MEKEQRTRLQKATQDARRLLEEEFRSQLLQTYDIDVEKVRWAEEPGSHLLAEQRLIREKLIAWIEHKEAQINDRNEALLLALREMAFTALNRFVALKLMEARELVRPCVSGGLESAGFLEFTAVAQGLLADQESSYRLYLETIFEDVSRELRALFDPRDPASLLWPKRAALLELLDILNRPELAELWSEDETLGWVYQYFNGDAERKKMREESSAPRNSRELAVRNQFFTPRYVVEFLTDNTLGRIWYEMRQGRSGLKERCRYLVRRPNEIWLQLGEKAPSQPDTDEALSQEEILRQPVHILHRELKDPREIRMLDPACGSMHFGLYAFDLYVEIYAEAWDIAQASAEQDQPAEAFASFVNYAETFVDKASFLREVPRLILLHNIHGIDIDPRATQIARLTLWLRAQRAWQEQQLGVADRMPITRSNVVCAEPMPGERDLLADFVDQQFPEVERGLVQQLLEAIFDKMQLAGDAGSLLKIEKEIHDAIDDARREWRMLAVRQQDLFSTAEMAALGQVGSSLSADLQNLTKDFWVNIEEHIYSALRHYAEQVESDGGFQRRLFAEDAAQGFAFIDLCRKRYDVALMNPPFGEASVPSKGYIDALFTNTKGDMYKTFVERFQERLQPSSYLGIISSRKGFFEGQSFDWREHVLLQLYSPALLVDLGGGVLDAMVETAAYVLRSLSEDEYIHLLESFADHAAKVAIDLDGCFSVSRYAEQRGLKKIQAAKEIKELVAAGYISEFQDSAARLHCLKISKTQNGNVAQQSESELICFRLIEHKDKAKRLAELIIAPCNSECFVVRPNLFRIFPNTSFAYWIGSSLRSLFTVLPSFEGNGRRVRVGLQTSDDFRFIRASWEVVAEQILNPSNCNSGQAEKETFRDWCIYETTKGALWVAFAKGGEYSPYYDDIHLLLNWANDGKELKAFACQVDGNSTWSRNIRSVDTYFLPGLTWPQRSQIGLNVRAKPAGTIHALMGSSAFVEDVSSLPVLLGLLNSSTFRFLVELSTSFGSYTEGAVKRTVIPSDVRSHPLEQKANAAALESLNDFATDETSHSFCLPLLLYNNRYGIRTAIAQCQHDYATRLNQRTQLQQDADAISFDMYGIADPNDREAINEFLGIVQADNNSLDEKNTIINSNSNTALKADLLVKQLASYLLGCILGRWDIRYATGEQATQDLPSPFAPLPVCPPGQLQNSQGLPARLEDVPAAYTVSIPWDGVLVDDPNHPLDLERRVREVIEIIWSGKEEGTTPAAIEHEVCNILGINTLRDWFRRPASFFADHLKRYSKSRRQAPIYWQLSAGNGIYSAWLYYHRFTQDTLYRVLRDFVEPRIQQAEREQFELESQGALSGDAATRLQEAQTLLQDLRILKSELDLVAPLWNPNLNDGVIINHAILWRITPYTPWQKKCKECWDKLVKGDYDWAHLAFHLWPERVIPKCITDRSLAIAHGLEERLWQETNNGNWLPRQLSETDLQALIAEHSNPAVKNALERFLAAPPPVAPTRTRASRSTRASGSSAPRRPRGTAAVVDADAARQVLLALTAAPSEGLAKAAIADLIGVEANALTAVIKQLKEGGQIDQLGERRGARYVLSEEGRAIVKQEEDGQ